MPPGISRNPTVTEWDPFAAVLHEGSIELSSGAAFDRDGRLIRASLYDGEAFKRLTDDGTSPTPPALIDGRIGSLISEWYGGFYHWLTDCIPRLGAFEATGLHFDGYLVPANLSDFQQRTLDRLGITEEIRVPFDGQRARAAEMVWAQSLSPHGFPTPYLVDWLRDRIGPREQRSDPVRRLYFSRRVRGVANEAEVWPIFAAHGFERIDCGAMTYSELQLLGSEARIIAGPHGSAFVNAIFSPKVTTFEFYHEGWLHSSGVSAILAAAGSDHYAIRGRMKRGVRSPKSKPMYIDPSVVATALTAVIDSTI